jgi:LacI family transcriptional regulator
VAATIRDVADACGVHISTVSRTFSAPRLVNPSTRTRVLEAARGLGYRPNRVARALTTGRTFNLGLIVADIANPYFPPLIKAAEAQARQRSYHVFVTDTDEDPVVEEDLVHALAKQVDGVVLGSPRVRNRVVEELHRQLPLVVVNRRAEGVPAVLMDVGRGAGAAVEHLAAYGHRHVALLGGPSGSWNNRNVCRGAGEAAEATGVALHVLEPNAPTEEGGAAAALDVLESGATAALAYNDLVALGLMDELGRLGVRVPDDLSIVGIDDIAVSRLTRPRLTTVAMPTAAAGRMAVDMLLQLVDAGPEPTTPRATLDTSLVVRESTAPPPRRRPEPTPGSPSRRDGERAAHTHR